MLPFSLFALRLTAGCALVASAMWSFPSAGQPSGANNNSEQARVASNGEAVTEINASPQKGFNYPYLLYLPPNADSKKFGYLLVEPNNSAVISNDLSEQRPSAIDQVAVNSDGNAVALRLGAPFLVPIFPRPAIAGGNLYTHALSRPTITMKRGPLKRIDLQLIAMIDDARGRLSAQGHSVASKVLMEGFSASGMFVSRFTFLHPDIVAAAAFGGVNGFLMLPIRNLDGHRLNYPLGLSDFAAISGHRFEKDVFNSVPQFAFMGATDTNDAVQFDDAYSGSDRTLIYSLVGKQMLPGRWMKVEEIYRSEGANVRFTTFPGIGHGTDGRIHAAVADFFMSAVMAKPVQ